MNKVVLKIIAELLNWRNVYFVWPLEHLIKKHPVPTKRATVILIKIKSCNSWLLMLLVCIGSYLPVQSVRRYKYVILNTNQPDIIIYVNKAVRIRLHFSKPKGGPRAKKMWGTAVKVEVSVLVVLWVTPHGHVLNCLVCNCCWLAVCIVVVVLCVLLSSYVYLLYYVCIAVFTLDAGLLPRSQYSEGPANGHLDTGFSWFPCVYKQMLRWFPKFQVATTCFSCSPPDLNLVVNNFIFCIHVK